MEDFMTVLLYYYTTAQETSLFKRIVVGFNRPIKRDRFIQFIFRSLHVVSLNILSEHWFFNQMLIFVYQTIRFRISTADIYLIKVIYIFSFIIALTCMQCHSIFTMLSE